MLACPQLRTPTGDAGDRRPPEIRAVKVWARSSMTGGSMIRPSSLQSMIPWACFRQAGRATTGMGSPGAVQQLVRGLWSCAQCAALLLVLLVVRAWSSASSNKPLRGQSALLRAPVFSPRAIW